MAIAANTVLIFYKLNDQFIQVSGLSDGLVPTTFMNGASASATLYNSAGVAVAGATSISLLYIPLSDGVYRGLIEETFDAPAGSGYLLKVDASQAGAVMHIEIKAKVAIRKT